MSLVHRFYFVAIASTLLLGILTGCGFGAADTSQPLYITPSLNGHSIGGSAPIVGATVKMYATGVTPGDGTSTNTGYGVGTEIAEASTIAGHSAGYDTDSNGSWSFSGGYDCPAGQFAYIVNSGGNPGSGINSNLVLVAALGRCEDLYTYTGSVYSGYKGSNIFIDELTTIAAAYALGQFSSESGMGAATQVLIGADSSNNAAQASGSTTAAAGLAHAFQNALNLVSPFGTTQPLAYTTLPGNASAQVPQALIHAIGNTIVACVNSPGGTANDGSVCGKVFTATTIGTSVPVDTFGALVNLAANPTLGGSPTAVTNFLNLATAQTTVYSPTLSTSSNTYLNDLSIAILYPQTMGASTTSAPLSTCPNSGTSPCQGIIYPISGALDVNDNYYIGNQISTGGSAGVNVISLASNGTINGSTNTNTTLKGCFGLSVDSSSTGNGYCANGSGASGSNEGGHFTFTPSTGVPSAAVSILTKSGSGIGVEPNFMAVDAGNNVWASGPLNGTTSTVYKSPAGGGSFTAVAAPTVAGGVTGLSIDPNQNVWLDTTGTSVYIVQNTGSVGTPTYSASNVLTVSLTSTSVVSPTVGITFAGTSSSSYTAYVSGYTTTPGIVPITMTLGGTNSIEVTSPTAGTTFNTNIAGTYYSQTDGASNIWLADVAGHAVVDYNPTAATAYKYKPCVQIASNLCGNTWLNLKPYDVSIDSAGSIWAPLPAVGSGVVVEIIGAAAPTWPLLSLGKLGRP